MHDTTRRSHASRQLARVTSPRIIGIDGCREGWVVVCLSNVEQPFPTVHQVADLVDIFTLVDNHAVDVVGIDMPIGLSDSDRRACDQQARKVLGARRSSVFPAPVRAALCATTYAEANQLHRRASTRGMSKQTFNIMSKIKEIDDAITIARQQRVVEVHPELSFATMTGTPLSMAKSTPEGIAERRKALCTAFPTFDPAVFTKIRGASHDDVLDAFAVAWSAQRFAAGTHNQFGGSVDRRGLRMEIIS